MKSTFFFIAMLTTKTILLTSAHNMGAPNYECGPHGRFEYCINGNPGCVVGCHCHPGYYFDTETKICESNIKLRMDYRREYNMPTPTTVIPTKLSPTPTEKNIVDTNVDAIAKDTDDLGDWLYNQFFKTIENQVINNTNEEKSPTRRSGSDGPTSSTTRPPLVSAQRRSGRRRKHNKKASKKKKRHSKKGLKKILRISEDDSLFDSSDASSESSGSSYSGSSSSSSSSVSSESDDSRSKEHPKDCSKNHGRKILMINKKPRPPLPSFIFMPNMETPYFPPLGLPPPPVMPMYPIIPVPPMMPSISIVQSTPAAATPAASQVTTTSVETTTNVATTVSELTTTSATPISNPPENKPDAGVDTEPPNALRSAGRKYRKGYPRNKFMKRLRDKMKRKYELPNPVNYFPDEVHDPELERINAPDALPESFMYDELREYDATPRAQDVRFKYLSQLIHKMNKTEAEHPPRPGTSGRARDIPHQRNFKPSFIPKIGPQRRAGNTNDQAVMKIEKDDYADLGKQIAALVRKIDTKGGHELSLDYEKYVSGNIPPQAIFTDNGMSSRSYWERFARSPFKISFDTEQYSNLDSSEKLLSLEDQISNSAITKPSLTLQQVENMINNIEAMKASDKKRVQQNKALIKERKKSPSVLLENPAMRPEFEGSHIRHVMKYNQQPKKENITNTIYKTHIDIAFKKAQPTQFNFTNPENVLSSIKTNPILDKRRTYQLTTEKQKQFHNNLPQRFKVHDSGPLHYSTMQQSHPALPTRKAQNPNTFYPLQNKRPNNIVNYKNWVPKTGVYHYENLIRNPDFSIGPLNKPSSYFHHQLHHFDYFD